MAELWGRASGVNRKLRELYARDGGANRKLLEMWARDSGAVGRKIFSEYDCTLSESNNGGASFSFNPKGGFRISLGPNAIDGDPGTYWFEITYDFGSPVPYSSGAQLLQIINMEAQLGQDEVDNVMITLADENNTFSENWYMDNFGTHTVTLSAPKNGSTSKLKLKVSATFGADAYCTFQWDDGDLYLFGKQINNVKLIYA